jgi:hypothetical protein
MKKLISSFLAFVLRFRIQVSALEISIPKKISVFHCLLIFKNILTLSKKTGEKIRAVLKNPKGAIDYFEKKLLFKNEVVTKNLCFEDRSLKSNLFGKAIFSANTYEEIKRDSYILLILKGIDPLSLSHLEIVLDIVDYDRKNKIFYQILFRHGYSMREGNFKKVIKYDNFFPSSRAA